VSPQLRRGAVLETTMIPSWNRSLFSMLVFSSGLVGCQFEQPTASSTPQVVEAKSPNQLVQATAVAPVPKPHEDLDATLWMQTSAEYGAITKVIYRAASDRLQAALADSSWSAIPGIATERASALPPAVILDVDETVLDNSSYQVQLIQNSDEYNPNGWYQFVATESSTAIPGAKEFVDACRAAGIQVFYVTNREANVETHTRANLQSQGLLGPEDENEEDTLLCKNEREDWTTDKTTRRIHVSQSYRVLLLLGDDLNDFVWVGFKPTVADRRAAAEQYDEYWGRKWFPFPNANYGGWERSLYYFQDELPHETKLRKKHEALNPP
jgi:acid phosphatase